MRISDWSSDVCSSDLFARETEFGQRLVNSLFTLGLMIGVSVGDTTLGTTVANLGMTDCRFPKPVFHGDTLHCTTTIAEKRESKSRSDAGIVLFEHRAHNPLGRAVAYCKPHRTVKQRPRAWYRQRASAFRRGGGRHT